MEKERMIAVLGTGFSLANFCKENFELSIGVNDIWRYVQSEAIVCLNAPNSFTSDRLKIINESKPQTFYSQMVIWDTRTDFQKIDLLPGYPDNFIQFDTPAFHKSFCSPFVAVQIAYKYYFADEIHLFGVDLINHPFLDKTLCDKIKIHFINLKTALQAKNCTLVIHGQGILKDI
jgi:hypothetical protein